MGEAERIYEAIFKAPIPLSIEGRFHKASQELSSGYSDEEKNEYRLALSRVSDLEALELAARRKNRLPMLVSQFKLMVYLAETLPENTKFYLNLKNRRLIWPFSFAFSGLRSAIKLTKGLFLLRASRNA